jgi:hypothetical protein
VNAPPVVTRAPRSLADFDFNALSPDARQTLRAAWLIAHGEPPSDAAEAVGIDRAKLRRRLDELADELTQRRRLP